MLRQLVAPLPRGRARIARALSHVLRKPFVDVVEPARLAVRLHVDPTDPWLMEAWVGAYQPHVVQFLLDHVRPGMKILTAGLAHGYIAALARRLAGPTGAVLSAEPDPRARVVAARSLTLADDRDAPIHVFEGAISDSGGTRRLHRSRTIGHSSLAGPHQPESEHDVLLVRGDDWLAGLGVRHLDVMVLDVEGWEVHALRGLAGTIERSAAMVAMVEESGWALRAAGESPETLRTWLTAAGFQITEAGMDIIARREPPR